MGKHRIGLALSGGSIKGLAHVGALEAFEELGIKIDIISGVSAGAIVASMYAAGVSGDDIVKFFKESQVYNFKEYLEDSLKSLLPNYFLKRIGKTQKSSLLSSNVINVITGKGGGLMDATPFKKKVKELVGVKKFEDLKIPVIVSATEMSTGKARHFSEGDLIDPVMASAAIPMILSPVKIDKKAYIDGGLISNISCSVLRDKCDFLIGIHVNPITEIPDENKFFSIFNRAFDLVINGSSTESEKKCCDLLFETTEACKYGMFELSKSEEIRKIGYDIVMSRLKDSPLLEKLRG